MENIVGVLAPALGVALNPFPIIATLIILSSANARIRGVCFLGGWMLGLLLGLGLLIVLANLGGIGPNESSPPPITSWIRIGIGTFLLLQAGRKWMARPGPDDEAALPGFLASLSTKSGGQILGFGALLSGVNPKNLLFNLAAASAIAGSGASVSGEVVAWLVYIAVASVLVIIPVGWFLIAPVPAAQAFAGPHRWLVRHNGAILAVVLVVIGLVLVANGIGDLR